MVIVTGVCGDVQWNCAGGLSVDVGRGALCENVSIGSFELVGVLRDAFGYGRVGGELAEEVPIVGELLETIGELGDVAFFEEEAVGAVGDGFGHAAEVGGDDGAAGGHGGVDDKGGVFVPDGGDDEDVEVGEDVADLGVGEGAGEVDAGVVGGAGLEVARVVGEFGEAAVDFEFDGEGGVEGADGIDEEMRGFVFVEGADEADAEGAGAAFVGVALEVLEVDAVRDVAEERGVDAVVGEDFLHEARGDEDAVKLVEALAREVGACGDGLDEGCEPASGEDFLLDGGDAAGDDDVGEDAHAVDDVCGLGGDDQVLDAVGGEGAGAEAEGAIGEAQLAGGADGPEIGGGEERGARAAIIRGPYRGVDGGHGETREVEEVYDVLRGFLEEALEFEAEELVVVFGLGGVGLAAHRDVLVEETADAHAFVFMPVEALVVTEGGGDGMGGEDGDFVAAALEFLRGVQG